MPRLRDNVTKPRHRKRTEMNPPRRDRALVVAAWILGCISIIWFCSLGLRLVFPFYHLGTKRELVVCGVIVASILLFAVGRILFMRRRARAKAS